MRLKIFIIIISVVVLAIIVIAFRYSIRQSSKEQGPQQAEEKKPSINGNLVSPLLASLRPLAIVIENHSNSRPQSGLTDAEIVYETIAEGGITRYLAIFQTRTPKTIGPVRSTRPYFNFIADAWHAPLIHAGGSKEALTELQNKLYTKLFDINEFSFPKSFYRDNLKTPPHNLFTTPELLRLLLSKSNQEQWSMQSMWQFHDTLTSSLRANVTTITIPFSTANYQVQYNYDTQTNSYQRSLNNQKDIDSNNDLVISPHNVIIHLTDIAPNLDDELGTVTIKLNNKGPCYLFSSGQFTKCQWEWLNNQFYYLDETGNQLSLQRGQTWIEIFPRNKQQSIIYN